MKQFLSFLFLAVAGFELMSLTVAGQVIYHLSHTSSPFFSGYF
jgi:hypothetical protein